MSRTKDAEPTKVKKEKKEKRSKDDSTIVKTEITQVEVEVKSKKSKKGEKEKKEKKGKSDEVGDEEPKKAKKDKKSSKIKAEEAPSAADETPGSAKKRKRASGLPEESEEELEIDVNAPEPPSKKALRKLKKAKTSGPSASTPKSHGTTTTSSGDAGETKYPEHASQSRSKHGIWIGNLSFNTKKEHLEEFLKQGAEDGKEIEITRVNLPINNSTGKNKGFAYVDFADQHSVRLALKLSEKYLGGRNVLIKDAHDFSNRNNNTSEATKTKASINLSKNPPSKILYVGNLDFGVTAEDVKEHFAFAGRIAKVRLATFEDSGKCKGFGFVDFADVESVTRAMMGLTPEEEETWKELEGKEEVEMQKLRKKRGMLGGRAMTMEYGEDERTRYKKRFGKERPQEAEEESREAKRGRGSVGKRDRPEREYEERERRAKREKVDSRSTDASAVYSADPRRSGAMVEGSGKKVVF